MKSSGPLSLQIANQARKHSRKLKRKRYRHKNRFAGKMHLPRSRARSLIPSAPVNPALNPMPIGETVLAIDERSNESKENSNGGQMNKNKHNANKQDNERKLHANRFENKEEIKTPKRIEKETPYRWLPLQTTPKPKTEFETVLAIDEKADESKEF
jgi:hypothetical protein